MALLLLAGIEVESGFCCQLRALKPLVPSNRLGQLRLNFVRGPDQRVETILCSSVLAVGGYGLTAGEDARPGDQAPPIRLHPGNLRSRVVRLELAAMCHVVPPSNPDGAEGVILGDELCSSSGLEAVTIPPMPSRRRIDQVPTSTAISIS
jgi:hypothetical protein